VHFAPDLQPAEAEIAPDKAGTYCALDIQGELTLKGKSWPSTTGKGAEMIAIPVMRGRVAPVLNWCSQMLLFQADPEAGLSQELWLQDLAPLERLQFLLAKGVHTLICGAMSTELNNLALQLGFRVISGVAGEVDEVLRAYRRNNLDRPEFWLPGCRGFRRYRQGFGKENGLSITEDQGGKSAMPGKGGRGIGQGQGRCRTAGVGPGGPGAGRWTGIRNVCICPACGAEAPHERGIPCFQINCPQCGKPMCGNQSPVP
jgi:hypothetical protein